MNTQDVARFFQRHRKIPELEAVRLAEQVMIRRKVLDDWWTNPFREQPKIDHAQLKTTAK